MAHNKDQGSHQIHHHNVDVHRISGPGEDKHFHFSSCSENISCYCRHHNQIQVLHMIQCSCVGPSNPNWSDCMPNLDHHRCSLHIFVVDRTSSCSDPDNFPSSPHILIHSCGFGLNYHHKLFWESFFSKTESNINQNCSYSSNRKERKKNANISIRKFSEIFSAEIWRMVNIEPI